MKNRHWILGKHAIEELLRFAPERFLRVQSYRKEDPLLGRLRALGIEVEIKARHELTALVGTDSHQGFAAFVKKPEEINIKAFLETPRDQSLVLMLDGITDPHNLGAILRAAECFGVDLVIWSKNRTPDVTPVVTKTSSGASEIVPIAKVSNLAETLRLFQKEDYAAIAADVAEGATPLQEFETTSSYLVLILGAEGRGVQPLLAKRVDERLYIPMHGQIDSLNVSQAAALFLSGVRTQKIPASHR